MQLKNYNLFRGRRIIIILATIILIGIVYFCLSDIHLTSTKALAIIIGLFQIGVMLWIRKWEVKPK